jgi:hypothetical protein
MLVAITPVTVISLADLVGSVLDPSGDAPGLKIGFGKFPL